MANYGIRGLGTGSSSYDLQVTNGSNYGGLYLGGDLSGNNMNTRIYTDVSGIHVSTANPFYINTGFQVDASGNVTANSFGGVTMANKNLTANNLSVSTVTTLPQFTQYNYNAALWGNNDFSGVVMAGLDSTGNLARAPQVNQMLNTMSINLNSFNAVLNGLLAEVKSFNVNNNPNTQAVINSFGSFVGIGNQETPAGILVPGVTPAPSLNFTTFAKNWNNVGLASLTNPAVSYQGCAMSSTGQYQSVSMTGEGSGYVWYSQNYGQTWAKASIAANNYMNLAMSATGQYQLTGINSYNVPLYLSTNYGATWTAVPNTSGPSYAWQSYCVSSTGQYMSAGEFNGTILYSSNSGSTWTASNAPNKVWQSMCCSASGQYQAVTTNNTYIYTSSNYGQTWTQSSSVSASWASNCCSSSGQYQSACVNGGLIYYSSNYGSTWTASSAASTNYYSISCDATGQYQVVVGPGLVLYSTDYGHTWTSATTSYSPYRVCMSADAKYVFFTTLGPCYLSITASN